jgi:hypothetical protein
MRAEKQMSQKRNLSTGLDLDSNKKRIEPEEFIYIDTWVLLSAFMLVSSHYNMKIK